jgi:hypothetical protein
MHVSSRQGLRSPSRLKPTNPAYPLRIAQRRTPKNRATSSATTITYHAHRTKIAIKEKRPRPSVRNAVRKAPRRHRTAQFAVFERQDGEMGSYPRLRMRHMKDQRGQTPAVLRLNLMFAEVPEFLMTGQEAALVILTGAIWDASFSPIRGRPGEFLRFHD